MGASRGQVDIGRYLRAQRELADLSQRALAKLTNVSDSYLSQIERGIFQPSPEVLTALAGGLGITPVVLFRKIGWLPEEDVDGIPSVADSIRADERLSKSQKAALLATYNAMTEGR